SGLVAVGAAQEVSLTMRAEPLFDSFGDLGAGDLACQLAGGGGTTLRRGPVRDDHGAFEAKQGGAAVGLGIEPAPQLAKFLASEHRSEPGATRAAQRRSELCGRERG